MGAGSRKLFSQWRPEYDRFVAPLHVNQPLNLDFSQFHKGIDNIHIDVSLSKVFRDRTQNLIEKTLHYLVAENCWGEPAPAPTGADAQAVKEAYTSIMEAAVAEARNKNNPALIQLLQLSVIKYFLAQTDQEFAFLREQLRGIKGQEKHDSTERSVEAHDQLVILAKKEPVIRYKILRKLFREMLWVERSRASKLRKSVLGGSWQIPKSILFNPLLQLPSLSADAALMNHYTLACTAKDNRALFTEVNRRVVGLFREFLPDCCEPVGSELPASREVLGDEDSSLLRTDEVVNDGSLMFVQIGRLLSSSLQVDEYQQGLESWLDSPQNIDKIIYSQRPWARYRFEGCENIINSAWAGRKWTGYYNRLLKRIFQQMGEKGLSSYILACQEAPAIYKELREQVPVRLICDYLSGRLKRRDLQRQLTVSPSSLSMQQIQKVLDRAVSDLSNVSTPRRRKHLLAFLHQFAQFRRDLKLAYRTHQAMNRINILQSDEAIELSRNNNTLYQFALNEEKQVKQRRIRNHVIIKADVRGSTEMTEQLKRKGLNPASHFSLNFFEPITKVLQVFGANKVFVEGDAVILSIYEYDDEPFQWLCVAHACGLARHILQVVDAQNIQNRRFDLPNLELGLGIAFSDDSPAFLYDGDREILISSAINRADQLSSCSAMIRRSGYSHQRGRGVEVFSSSTQAVSDKESSDHLKRYNVNGIELDLPAFYKLKSELNLRKIGPTGISQNENDKCFFVARFPDMRGRMHWVVVREGVVKSWGDEEAIRTDGRRFFEVVTDDELIKRVKAKVAGEPIRGEDRGKRLTGDRHYL